MEDAKLISLHDTLKMLAPKGKVGGLGFYVASSNRSRRSAADSMPEEKKMLYSNFVRQGEGPSGHKHWAKSDDEERALPPTLPHRTGRPDLRAGGSGSAARAKSEGREEPELEHGFPRSPRREPRPARSPGRSQRSASS